MIAVLKLNMYVRNNFTVLLEIIFNIYIILNFYIFRL